MMHYDFVDSPLGPLLVAGDEAGLRCINFQHGTAPRAPEPDWVRGPGGPVGEALRQLAAYFGGRRRAFDLPLAAGGTPFQRRVWAALLTIPYGETITYGELARRVGRPTAARAVGAANGRNPLPVVVPCHRVIGGDGRLTGFYGGLHLKSGLLALEGATTGAPSAPGRAPAVQPALF